MKYKAILFDLDNTLIDFVRFKEVCTNAAIDAMIKAGLKMPKSRAKKLINEIYKKSHFEDPEIYQKFMLRAFGGVDYRIISAGIVAYRKARPGVMKPYPGVKPTLKKLKRMGLKLGIVTDAPRIKAWLRLTYLDITDLFDVVLTLDDFKERKPSPKPFMMAVKKLKVKTGNTVFVGDNPRNDIMGANRVGMTTVFGRYGLYTKWGVKLPSKDFKPDYVICDIRELLKIVS